MFVTCIQEHLTKISNKSVNKLLKNRYLRPQKREAEIMKLEKKVQYLRQNSCNFPSISWIIRFFFRYLAVFCFSIFLSVAQLVQRWSSTCLSFVLAQLPQLASSGSCKIPVTSSVAIQLDAFRCFRHWRTQLQNFNRVGSFDSHYSILRVVPHRCQDPSRAPVMSFFPRFLLPLLEVQLSSTIHWPF